MPADENTLPILRAVSVCVKPDDTEDHQLGDSDAMTDSLLFQICFRLYYRPVIFKNIQISNIDIKRASIIFLSRQCFIDCIVTPNSWTI